MELAHARVRKLVERHFAGRSRPDGDATMRAHLVHCDRCRSYYEGHLVLAAADPAAIPADERMARGLGFQRPRPNRPALFAIMTVALAAAGFVVVGSVKQRTAPLTDFVSRGGNPLAEGPALRVFRVSGGVSTQLTDRMNADDALAFAYLNPTGYSHLVVVGVDEQAKLYWYHPDPDERPASVQISRSARAAELPEAIRHRYQGHSLKIVGIFSHEPLSVDKVTRAIDGSGCAALTARLPSIGCVETTVAISRSGSP